MLRRIKSINIISSLLAESRLRARGARREEEEERDRQSDEEKYKHTDIFILNRLLDSEEKIVDTR